jgi:hypothetical protein
MSNTTSVVGYYNGNRWPIQLVISKLNITLTLEPGKYILDRQGRKVNDPYFEVFANNKQLHRELSETPVPILVIPEVAPTVTASPSSNPVRAVTEWTRDARGIRQPVLTQPSPKSALPPAVLASATESVRPMSMDEARAQGLVRKVREVPEDYGVNDTTGLPPGGIPKMRYSLDPSMNKPVVPLPKEMLALPKDDPNRQTRSQLVAGLAQGARTPAPEDASASPFANTTVVNAPPNSPLVAGTPLQEAVEPEPTEYVPMSDLGEVDVPSEVAPPAPAVPSPKVAPAVPALNPLTSSNRFRCLACGAPHKFRSQLFNHVQAKHPTQADAIMANYPQA